MSDIALQDNSGVLVDSKCIDKAKRTGTLLHLSAYCTDNT